MFVKITKNLKINNFLNLFKLKLSVSNYSSNSYLTEISYENFDFNSKPVLAEEVIQTLKPKNGQTILDMTFGDGGHTLKLLNLDLDITVLTLDRDPYSYAKSVELAKTDKRVFPMIGKFSQIKKLFLENKIDFNSLDGVLIDLGVSNLQLNDRKRGFKLFDKSFLDMRMDANYDPDSITASEVLNLLDEESLRKIFKNYGKERKAKKFSDLIVDSRTLLKEIKSTSELVFLISSISSDLNSDKNKIKNLNSASKIFLALRMFVNNELNELNYCLETINSYMKKDDKLLKNFNGKLDESFLNYIKESDAGKIAVITFNEQEDTIVEKHFNYLVNNSVATENFFKTKAKSFVNADLNLQETTNQKYFSLTKNFIEASDEEKKINLRSISAKLRSAIRFIE